MLPQGLKYSYLNCIYVFVYRLTACKTEMQMWRVPGWMTAPDFLYACLVIWEGLLVNPTNPSSKTRGMVMVTTAAHLEHLR